MVEREWEKIQKSSLNSYNFLTINMFNYIYLKEKLKKLGFGPSIHFGVKSKAVAISDVWFILNLIKILKNCLIFGSLTANLY